MTELIRCKGVGSQFGNRLLRIIKFDINTQFGLFPYSQSDMAAAAGQIECYT